ncbi:MAG TPA: DMT family transporter, partial [Acidimicrobiales bacterium]|nr:DMT family transporter [Acidimicrobiales bacterium]
AAVPLIGAVLAWATKSGDRLGSVQLVGLGIGLGGVAALVGLDVHHVDALSLVEMLVVATCYALGPWIIRQRLSDVPPLGVVAGSLAVAAVAYAPVAAIQWPRHSLSASVVESVIGLALVCTVVAFIAFFALIAEVGAVKATVITYLNPAVAVLLGVTILHESLTAGMIIGFVLTLAGCALATRKTAPKAAVAPVTVEPTNVAAAEIVEPSSA